MRGEMDYDETHGCADKTQPSEPFHRRLYDEWVEPHTNSVGAMTIVKNEIPDSMASRENLQGAIPGIGTSTTCFVNAVESNHDTTPVNLVSESNMRRTTYVNGTTVKSITDCRRSAYAPAFFNNTINYASEIMDRASDRASHRIENNVENNIWEHQRVTVTLHDDNSESSLVIDEDYTKSEAGDSQLSIESNKKLLMISDSSEHKVDTSNKSITKKQSRRQLSNVLPSKELPQRMQSYNPSTLALRPISMSSRGNLLKENDQQSVSSVERNLPKSNAKCCIIDILCKRHFTQNCWSGNERVEIIRNGPPRPIINPTISAPFIQVSMMQYIMHPWLTGCTLLKKLCCWPCLLFSGISAFSFSLSNSFSSTGSLLTSINKHAQTSSHRETEILLNQWTRRITRGGYIQLPKVLRMPTFREPQTVRNDDWDLSLDEQRCVVSKLVLNHFIYGRWSDEARKRIILNGRPTPKMKGLTNVQGRQQTFIEHFNEILYRNVWWLTGSPVLGGLFCWPCLLFNSEGTWCKKGHSNLNTLNKAISEHETSHQHMDASLRLRVWEKQMDRKLKTEIVSFHDVADVVERNREFWKYIVSVVCCTKTKLLDSDLFYEHVWAITKHVKSHQLKLKNYLKYNYMASKTEVFDILASIEICLKSRIIEDQKEALFISLILNSVGNGPWLSVCVRYVCKGGDVHERFLKFIKFDRNQPPEFLVGEILLITKLLKCEQRLIGFCYNGSFQKPSDFAMFNAGMQEKFPSCQFFHHRDHNLNVSLCQTLSQLNCCKTFFHGIKEMSRFFDDHPEAVCSINRLINIGNEGPIVGLKQKDATVDLVSTIKLNYHQFIVFFESIAHSFECWDNETVLQASYFVDFLRAARNQFLIYLSSTILDLMKALAEAFEKKFVLDIWMNHVMLVKQGLESIQNIGFDYILVIACRWEQDVTDHIQSFREIFNEVLDSTFNFIDSRSATIERWSSFEAIFHHDLNQTDRSNILTQRLPLLQYSFPADVRNRLVSQMIFLHSNPSFQNKCATELIKILYDLDLLNSMSGAYEFIQFVLTVPIGSQNSSATSTMTKISASTEDGKVINSLHVLLNIENDLLVKMQKESDFYDKVIDCFAVNTDRKNLLLIPPHNK